MQYHTRQGKTHEASVPAHTSFSGSVNRKSTKLSQATAILAAISGLSLSGTVRAEEVAVNDQNIVPKAVVAVPLRPGNTEALKALADDPLTQARALQALQIPGAAVDLLTLQDDVETIRSTTATGSATDSATDSGTGSLGLAAGGASPGLSSGDPTIAGVSAAGSPAGAQVASVAVNPPLDANDFEVPLWQDPAALRIDAPYVWAPEILSQVAAVLQLGSPREIHVEALPVRELQARARERIVASQSRASVQARESTYKRLGLLSDTYDLRQSMLEQYPARVLAMFSPVNNTVEVADALSPQASQVVLSRELVHALQEQNFNLRETLASASDEKARTLRAVVEGQGLLVSRQVVGNVPGQNVTQGPMNSCPDPFALAHFDLPLYTPGSLSGAESPLSSLGGAFLEQYSRRFGPTTGALAALPVSTEQLIHFEKYASGDRPQALSAIELVSEVGRSWKVSEQTTIGEMLMACWLGESLGGLASSGWGNDILTSFEGSNGRKMLAWRTVWDSEQDAVEFAGAARARLRYRFDTVTFLKQIPYGLILATDEEAHGVVRMGSEVRVVIGADVEQIDKLITAEW